MNVRGLADEIGLDRLVPGDIIITNDPFSGDAMCTHTMDIHLLRPVFRDGRVIALAWAFIHASDIGGAVAGSIAPPATRSSRRACACARTCCTAPGN